MRVDQLMREPPIVCRFDDPLSVPAQLMWDHDVGAVLVTDHDGRLTGVITDRDLAMATYTQGSAPHVLRVQNAMARRVFSCEASDSLEAVQALMRDRQIRRIPIVGDDGRPLGMVSVSDLVRHAQARGSNGDSRELVETLAAIGASRRSVRASSREMGAGSD